MKKRLIIYTLIALILFGGAFVYQKFLTVDKELSRDAKENTVSVNIYSYSPENIRVKKGATVTWINAHSVKHTVTSDGEYGPKSDYLNQGEKYSFTFDRAGSFSYHCEPHPFMRGVVEVEE